MKKQMLMAQKMSARLFAFFLFLACVIIPQVHAASSGPTSAGTFADDNSVGSETWSPPGNAANSDNNQVQVGVGGSISHYLKVTNFGFSIPTDATITGVSVTVERGRDSFGGNIKDSSVRLVQDGTIAGDNKATTDAWLEADTLVTYGSSGDLWGLSLSPTQINDASFGMVFSAYDSGCSGLCFGVTAYVDHITITVHYTPYVAPSTGDSAAPSSGGRRGQGLSTQQMAEAYRRHIDRSSRVHPAAPSVKKPLKLEKAQKKLSSVQQRRIDRMERRLKQLQRG